MLSQIQSKIRTPVLDYYFAWTANLASHTFYVLMLPASNWFGSASLARDLVYVLGLGIYLTGNLKDCLCLPRPRSPPVHRITMSSYTTQEYGFPSSHSANATAVSLIILMKIIEIGDQFTPPVRNGLIVVLFLYYFSLIFGRLYCGMHGLVDIFTGSFIGVIVFLFRYKLGDAWDNLLVYNTSFMAPIAVIIIFVACIHFHFDPVDDCPCFDDSVAFIGVLIGLDLSHWYANYSQYFLQFSSTTVNNSIIIDYDYSRLGVYKSILRVIVGVGVVGIWKSVSKPIIFTVLPPVYKAVGVYLPRRNYKSTAFSHQSTRHIRRQSISNMKETEKIGEFNQLLRGVTDHKKTDSIGPESDIDYYEIMEMKGLDTKGLKDLDTNNQGRKREVLGFKSGVFKSRYDVEIIGRIIVYAGVSTMSVWGFALVCQGVGLL